MNQTSNNAQTPSALIIIDVQKGFDSPYWGQRNNVTAETNIAKILTYWRNNHFPVIHIQHQSTEANSPLRPNQPGVEFKDMVQPTTGEPVFVKSVNSAFIGTDLEQYLRTQGIQDLVIIGLTTDHCVSTTTRMAGNLGFNVLLVEDACATFAKQDADGIPLSAELIHRVHLASLDGEFCQVVVTSSII